MNNRHIVAFGGLSQSIGTTHPIISYILSLVPKKHPKVCFIPTAVGDSPTGIVSFYDRIPAHKAERSHLSLFGRTIEDIRGYLLNQDVILVSGGNTANMLAIWRIHGVDEVLREAWEAGIILCGGSAGSLCWFECGTTDSFNLNKLAPLNDGLGFLPGSHCPHYDGEAQRRPLYQRLISEGFPAGYAIDNDAAIHFGGGEITDIVSSRKEATAYYVEKVGDSVIETKLEAKLLSS